MRWQLLLTYLAAASAAAFPDGAPWEAAQQEGCNQCHFDAAVTRDSKAVEIVGLPGSFAPGRRYRLTLRLVAEDMQTAGFLLTALAGTEPAGRFVAVDDRVATALAQARSTEAGTRLQSAGVAEWAVEWIAPETAADAVLFLVWANASNDDRSPFGDATHRRVWRLDASSD